MNGQLSIPPHGCGSYTSLADTRKNSHLIGQSFSGMWAYLISNETENSPLCWSFSGASVGVESCREPLAIACGHEVGLSKLM